MSNTKIKDVAELAGVSVATVSRVLNNKGYISKETYEKVYDAISKLDYIPNQLARSLYKQHSWYISLIVPDSSNPFWAEITKYIEVKLYDRGYKLFLCNTKDDANREREYIRMMRQNMVDGIILGTHMLEIDEYQNLTLPIVALDLFIWEHIPTICVDHVKGGQLAAQEFIKNRCNCVLNIRAILSKNSPSLQRHLVFDRLLTENGIQCINYDLKKEADKSEYSGIVNRLFDEYPQIDGVFSEDLLVVNAMKCALERGISIPEKLKIVGYDGTDWARLCYPPITFVAQPIELLASVLVDVLLRKISGEVIGGNIILPDIIFLKGKTSY